MDIKEIALKAGYSTVPAYWLSDEKPIACSTSNFERLVSFAEALIAELAKQNEPVAWARYPKFTGSTQRQEIVFKKPDELHNWVCLYTIPPTTEQIANETAWQPIETAPKDGTRVLLCIDHGEWGDKVWTGLWGDGWMVSYGKARTEPTHWMPLPKAPANGASS